MKKPGTHRDDDRDDRYEDADRGNTYRSRDPYGSESREGRERPDDERRSEWHGGYGNQNYGGQSAYGNQGQGGQRGYGNRDDAVVEQWRGPRGNEGTYGNYGREGARSNYPATYGSHGGSDSQRGSNWGGESQYGGSSRSGGSHGSGEFESRRSERGPFAGRGPKSYTRSDERIREEVCDCLTDDGYVDASDVEVTVSNGAVTLSGMVSERGAKHHIERLAEGISGVRDVHNSIRVRSRDERDDSSAPRSASSVSSSSAGSSDTSSKQDTQRSKTQGSQPKGTFGT